MSTNQTASSLADRPAVPATRRSPLPARTGDVSKLTDEEIVSRVLAGEIELFRVLMGRHSQRVFRAARSIVRNEADAEDVVQETYARAFCQRFQFQGRAPWSTWVTRIAVNEALGRLRRRKPQAGRRPAGTEEGVDGTDHVGAPTALRGPEDQAAARELRVYLDRAVSTLPDIYRSVFVLRDVEEFSTAEAADSLGISEELVKVRLHRARGELRGELESRVGTAADGPFGFHPTRTRGVTPVVARCRPDNDQGSPRAKR